LGELTAALLAGAANAAEVDVSIQNLTGGSFFTPLIVAVHSHDVKLFEVGAAASASLQAMAEGGDISGLSADLSAAGAVTSENPAGGLLAPGMATSLTLTGDGTNDSLSLAAMILPTNDGFVALNDWKIPESAGTYTLYLNAYDAGTEGNNEVVNGAGTPGAPGIPADPGGRAGSGASGIDATAEGYVHIHRGVLGDTDASGGVSDLDSRVHRWLNPVAKVTVTVK
jgi:hypothetical protein